MHSGCQDAVGARGSAAIAIVSDFEVMKRSKELVLWGLTKDIFGVVFNLSAPTQRCDLRVDGPAQEFNAAHALKNRVVLRKMESFAPDIKVRGNIQSLQLAVQRARVDSELNCCFLSIALMPPERFGNKEFLHCLQ